MGEKTGYGAGWAVMAGIAFGCLWTLAICAAVFLSGGDIGKFSGVNLPAAGLLALLVFVSTTGAAVGFAIGRKNR